MRKKHDKIFLQNVVKGDAVQTVAIRDLKNNPSNMTKYLEQGESVFVTKHGKPIGITLPLNNDAFSIGVKKTVAVELYKMDVISLGKMAELLELNKQEAMSLLNNVNVNWLEDDTQVISKEAAIQSIHLYPQYKTQQLSFRQTSPVSLKYPLGIGAAEQFIL